MLSKNYELSNESLFELSKLPANTLAPELKSFLESCETPWAVLGKPLTAFVKARVEAVPPAERRKGKISPQAYLIGEDICIEEGAIIEPGAYIAGPTYIESGVEVRHGAYVRGSVYACSGAVIGHTSEVKGSLLLSKAKAAHFAYVGDSILGIDVNMGAGTKLANLRLDHGEVKVSTGNSRIATGLKKFGAILGNRAQTGCNSVLNPGTILMPGALVSPTKAVSGTVGGPKNSNE